MNGVKEEKIGVKGFAYLNVVRLGWGKWELEFGYFIRVCKIGFDVEMNVYFREGVCGYDFVR